jgi:hypothetical protein
MKEFKNAPDKPKAALNGMKYFILASVQSIRIDAHIWLVVVLVVEVVVEEGDGSFVVEVGVSNIVVVAVAAVVAAVGSTSLYLFL